MIPHHFFLAAVLAVFVTFWGSMSLAMPTFARQYKTGCMTCHMAYPRLNPVGEAFRLNGYKFADDELYRKEQLVDLGDEAYKKLWPESIWPNRLSMTSPLSLISTWIVEWDTNPGTDPYTGEEQADVKFLTPHEIELAWAGSLDDHLSAYGDLRFVQEDFSSDETYSWLMIKAWLQFEDLLGPENLLNLQIGSVGMHTLGLFNAREEQKIGFLNYLLNGWSMPSLLLDINGLTFIQDPALKDFEGNTFVLQPQTGLEFNGFGRHWLYYLGVVNGNIRNPMYSPPEDSVFFMGSGANTDSKDYYAGFVYKFGAIGFDGSGAGDLKQAASAGNFWRDDSLLLALFGYSGTARITTTTWDVVPTSPISPHTVGAHTFHIEDDKFWRFGAGLAGNYRDFSLNLGYMLGRNDNPYGYLDTLYGNAQADAAVDSTSWFAEAYYFVYPWLIPFLRYESLKLEGLPAYLILEGERDREIMKYGCRVQMRANVNLRVEAVNYLDDQGYDYGLDHTVFFILNASF
jgi:hypothetical protein